MQVCSLHTSFAVSRCWEGKHASERNTVAQVVIKQALEHQSHSLAVRVPVDIACSASSSTTQPREDSIHYHYQLINGLCKISAWTGHRHSSNVHIKNNIRIQVCDTCPLSTIRVQYPLYVPNICCRLTQCLPLTFTV